MNYEELLEMLDLDDPSGFEYFENLADLLECNEEISMSAIARLIKDVDNKVLAELLEEYFNEVLNGVPDSATEFYTLLQTIGLSMSGMAAGMIEEDDVTIFCEELDRFRNWYTEYGIVNVRPEGGDISDFRSVSPLEALSMARAEKLVSGEAYEYDFEPALDYELKDYVMSFSDVAAAEDGEGDEMPAGDDILMDGYVYDDEFHDEI